MAQTTEWYRVTRKYAVYTKWYQFTRKNKIYAETTTVL